MQYYRLIQSISIIPNNKLVRIYQVVIQKGKYTSFLTVFSALPLNFGYAEVYEGDVDGWLDLVSITLKKKV